MENPERNVREGKEAMMKVLDASASDAVDSYSLLEKRVG